MNSSRWEEALIGSILGIMLLVAIVLLLLAGWCLVRAINLVLRVLVRHLTNRVLRLALTLFFVLVAIAAIETSVIFVGLASAAGVRPPARRPGRRALLLGAV